MSKLYYENSSTLCHHGVKGMKWGVRRFQDRDGRLTSAGKKRYYGMDSRGLKKAIKSAKKENRKRNGMVFDGSTGKNWDSVKKELAKETDSDKHVKELRRKRDEAYRNAEKFYDRDIEKAMKYQDAGDAYERKAFQRSAKIGEKYGERFSNALLKDINYDDVERGQQMLRDYGIDIKIDPYSGAKIVKKNQHQQNNTHSGASSKNSGFVPHDSMTVKPGPNTKVDGPPYDEPKVHKTRPGSVRY